MPPSWRDTLFVWDGILVVENPSKDDDEPDETKVKWYGTWVGVDQADATLIEAPKRGAFANLVDSEMAFEVEGSAIKQNEKEEGGSSGYVLNLTSGEGWDLETDGTKSKHTDKSHEVSMINLRWTGNLSDQTVNIVVARGSNEHGPFVSAGWLRVGNRLTLGRRYLDEGDSRAKWDLDDLRKAILGEICEENSGDDDASGTVRIPPWQCSALHAQDMTGKRRKVETPASDTGDAGGEEEKTAEEPAQ